jgi:hypothetical protein
MGSLLLEPCRWCRSSDASCCDMGPCRCLAGDCSGSGPNSRLSWELTSTTGPSTGAGGAAGPPSGSVGSVDCMRMRPSAGMLIIRLGGRRHRGPLPRWPSPWAWPCFGGKSAGGRLDWVASAPETGPDSCD